MDTARQVLRFSIPGAVLLLNGIVGFLIMRRLQGVPYSESLGLMRQNFATLVGVLAVVPVGYLTYQVYHAVYGPTVRPPLRRWNGRYVRLDRGSQVLHHLGDPRRRALELLFGVTLDFSKPHGRVRTPKHRLRHPYKWAASRVKMLELTSEWHAIPTAEREQQYRERWYANWDVLRAVLDIAGANPSTAQVKSEYVALSDLYHSLGATRVAVTFSWFGTVAIIASHPDKVHEHLAGTVAGLVLLTIVTALLSYILFLARRRTWLSAASSLRLGLHWLFTQHPELFAPRKAKKPKRSDETSALTDENGAPTSREWPSVRKLLRTWRSTDAPGESSEQSTTVEPP
jgi:hypothetical protein